jgi:adenylate cyclase
MPDDHISLSEASRIAGVSPSTLQRWVKAGVIPVRRGRWTTAAAAQARVVSRLRERGHSLAELRRAGREGRLAFGYVEDLFPGRERNLTRIEAAERTGLEEALIERMMALLGTPTAIEGALNEQDVEAMEHIRDVLRAGFPLVALLQLIRVYAQSIRKIAEAEVRLFHLYVHEPLIRQGVDALQMAEEMEGGARRRPATRARADGVLLRRSHRVHSLHGGGGGRGGVRPGRTVRGDRGGDAPCRGPDRQDDRGRGHDRLA